MLRLILNFTIDYSERNTALLNTSKGQELTGLYYQLSPVMVGMMAKDPAFRAELKGMVDEVLMLIEKEAE